MQQGPILRVEELESRSTPAGIVTITGWGAGNINVVGDNNGNGVTISGGPASITTTSDSSTSLTLSLPPGWTSTPSGNSFGPGSSVTITPSSGSLGQLFVDLKAGNDMLGIFNYHGAGDIIILPGTGDDKVTMGDVTTTQGALIIRDPSGNDLVTLDAVKALNPSLISLSLGNDRLLIAGSVTQFDSDLQIDMGAGSDQVRFTPGQSWIKGNLYINTTSGTMDGGDNVIVDFAVASSDPATLRVDGNTTIITGNGADKVLFGFGSGAGPSAVLGSSSANTVNIDMGNHNDRIFASRVQFQKLTAQLGNGDDQVLNDWSLAAAAVSVAPGSVLDGGPHITGTPGDTGPVSPTVFSGTVTNLTVTGFYP